MPRLVTVEMTRVDTTVDTCDAYWQVHDEEEFKKWMGAMPQKADPPESVAVLIECDNFKSQTIEFDEWLQAKEVSDAEDQ